MLELQYIPNPLNQPQTQTTEAIYYCQTKGKVKIRQNKQTGRFISCAFYDHRNPICQRKCPNKEEK